MMNQKMGLEFLDRTLKTWGVVLLIFLVFGMYYLGLYPTLSAVSGGVWAAINLIFTSALVRSVLRPEGADKKRAIMLMLFKFPALYISGYFLLTIPQFDTYYLLGGFTGLFAVLFLRALGTLIVATPDKSENQNHEVTKAV